MWLLRLLAVILVVAIGASLLIYVVTGNRYYLAVSWRLFRYGIVFALIVFALMFIERLAVHSRLARALKKAIQRVAQRSFWQVFTG
jgi:uncharacterized membrane protein